MDAFVWDQRFETGIPLVDAQHRQLVESTNQLGNELILGSLDEARLQSLFHSLAKYAHHHFADEERLMREQGIDERHLREHALKHRQFVEQIVGMWRSRSRMASPGETLHRFLTLWLTVHILGEDHDMAQQMQLIDSGHDATEAFSLSQSQRDPSTSILLDAFDRLYGLLSAQNQALVNANQNLEQRINERTQELKSANLKLEAEQLELKQLLNKVEETQQQLLQSEKLAAIGQLAAGVAHEINNPVGFVNSNLGSLKTYTHQLLQLIDAYEQGNAVRIAEQRKSADIEFLREDLPELLEESRSGLERVTRIVQSLKDFSHVEQAEKQLTNLNAAIQNTLNVVSNELKLKADIILELGNIPDVFCIPAQVNQVFMNLLLNAAQAIPEQGNITVRSGLERDHVWFEIEDNGIGISEDVRKRIFEPFFTTKAVGKGTGLGLSISYDTIVKKHNGQIDVRSEPGKGSCFRLSLPVAPCSKAATD